MVGRYFGGDERAIEGLPIRLVIAVAVGIAAFSLLLGMLSDVEPTEPTEVTVEAQGANELVIENGTDSHLEMEVIDENGMAVPEATVIITSNTARVQPAVQARSGGDGEIDVTVSSDDVSLLPGQEAGTLEIEIVPPSDSNWVDESSNPAITVIR